MFRTIITSGVLAAGSLAGLTLTPSSAEAHPPAVIPVSRPVFVPSYYPPSYYPPVGHDWHRHRARFDVLVRHRGHWDLYDTVRDWDDARRLAHRLRHQGYDVDIRRR
jgi:hypothetical protein